MREKRSSRTTIAALVSACSLLLCGGAAAAQAQAPPDLALGQPASASSVERPERGGDCLRAGTGCAPANANDGDSNTRWGADWEEGQWWQVDLGRARAVDTLRLSWEYSFPRRYRISTSLDGVNFVDALEVQPPFASPPFVFQRQYVETSAFRARLGRFVRITSIERFRPQYGISLWDVRVTGPADESVVAPPAPAPTSSPAPTPATSPSGPAAGAPQSPSGTGTGSPPTRFESAGSSAAGTGTPARPAPAPTSPRPAAGSRPSGSAPARLELLRPFPIVRIRGSATPRGASIEFVSVRASRDARVRVVCRGRSCPRREVRQSGSGRVRSIRGFLRAGTVIEIFVTRQGRLGKYTRLVIRGRSAPPQRRDSCAKHGAARPTTCS